ncbi:MAG TPA: AAA family ATPase, partial [Polyangiales bacterium]|nr:AAA family ATPase [Polyangiales bacterium]
VEGDSGIGKSALVEHSLELLQQSVPPPLMLRSRCYENELVAYKAFDGAIDELARVLAAMPPAECEALLPPQAALACRLFPALAAVERLAKMPLRPIAADPAAQRLDAFSAVKRLFAKLGESRLLVLAIDDLQWADGESFRLLRSLFEGDDPVRCLVLATVRPPNELDADAAEGIQALRTLGSVVDVRLRGLPADKARALARELMGARIPESWIEIVVRESAGHPLFLTVLARFAESHDPQTAAELTLDAAIAAHIGGLSRSSRRLLETVAVVGSPLSAALCGHAAGLNPNELRQLTVDLCNQRLLRRRRADEIGCFHDRIRRVAVESLPRAQARSIHAAIAEALATHGNADPSELARHYEAAGDATRAFDAYRRSADKANTTLAFARAATLYGRALDIARELALAPELLVTLRTERGHAFARSGQSARAAREYLEAAEAARGAEQTHLRIWAAQHLLQSAHVDEGMRAARALLVELGVPLPQNSSLMIARLLWDRMNLRASGLNITAAPSGGGSTHARMQLDALWGLSMPVAWIDPLASALLSTRHLRIARSLGEPTHMARALAEEAFARTLESEDGVEANRLLARARTLCEANYDPALDMVLSFREATVATFRWDLHRARERLEHAQEIGTASCADQPWLLTNVRTNLGSVWMNMGEYTILNNVSGAWLAEAQGRNDAFALTMIEGLGFGSFRHLMNDRPDRVIERMRELLARWPREPFSFAHFGEMLSTMYAELYRGGDGALRWIEGEMPRLKRALLVRTSLGQVTHHMMHAAALIAARSEASASRVADYDRQLQAIARQLAKKSQYILGRINSAVLDAQLLALSGDVERAFARALEGQQLAERQGSHFTGQSLLNLAGFLEGGDAGQAKQRAARRFFSEHGWKNPESALAIMSPVLRTLIK